MLDEPKFNVGDKVKVVSSRIMEGLIFEVKEIRQTVYGPRYRVVSEDIEVAVYEWELAST